MTRYGSRLLGQFLATLISIRYFHDHCGRISFLARYQASSSGSKMSGRFSKKRYPRKVVFKAMEEHGEDDEEPVLKTPLTHMVMDNLGHCLNYMSDDPHVLKFTSTNYKKQKVVEHTKSTTYRTREKPMIGFGVPNATEYNS
ncbi:hypothetical protein AgCh_019498 [Apium graveolens]